jgi:hypothetical protein
MSEPATIEQFLGTLATRLADLDTLSPPGRVAREDGTAISLRFEVAAHVWLDLTLRPDVPQVRAGIMTDDRWVSEDLEQAIEDSGDTMSEFVELGFEEADLAWLGPPVEHYREQGQYFYFSTGFEPSSTAALVEPDVMVKAERMVRGYYLAFRPAIDKLRAEEA